MGLLGIITFFPSLLVLMIMSCLKNRVVGEELTFDENYFVTYSQDHFVRLRDGSEVQLSLDQASGTCFKSKLEYGSGYFQMKLKLPSRASPGVVTTFYLHSNLDNDSGAHDELDFEFLGTEGPEHILQTNIFANDTGGREQRLRLWFDPTLTFHSYSILWNSHQIVFFVDEIPIRVFKNHTSIGGRYPSQAMVVMGSIWNGEAWASGGKKVDWSQAPFQANYKGFVILGCPFGNRCDSEALEWNSGRQWQLNPRQQELYEDVKRTYVYYDYCSNPTGRELYKECQFE
ncbi:xyloglucan endotransglucosylase/hydrolase protein 2-like [Cucurbita moschata]|uniref:Xyloglucan endotransglucosylase/hydrolase protein 2-like n=1 Tax=Cucurbita moschata TaxID=3662 RepID=A0A6J1HBJ0_CUCMO|nr:xyloglucan endotransglucosylase/hydrolase protein 2-like [Cucurbita moschata]